MLTINQELVISLTDVLGFQEIKIR